MISDGVTINTDQYLGNGATENVERKQKPRLGHPPLNHVRFNPVPDQNGFEIQVVYVDPLA